MTTVFPSEKILTISATEYVGMVGKELSDYSPSGVIYVGTVGAYDISQFIKKIPEQAEVVVGLQSSLSVSTSVTSLQRKKITEEKKAFLIIGTALIPKHRWEESIKFKHGRGLGKPICNAKGPCKCYCLITEESKRYLLKEMSISPGSSGARIIGHIFDQVDQMAYHFDNNYRRKALINDLELFLKHRDIYVATNGNETEIAQSIQEWIRSCDQPKAIAMQQVFSEIIDHNSKVYHSTLNISAITKHKTKLINSKECEKVRHRSIETFKARYPNGVKMYRGVKGYTSNVKPGNIRVIPSCLSSWTTKEPSIASGFARHGGYVLSMHVYYDKVAVSNEILQVGGHSYTELEYILFYDKQKYPNGWEVESIKV